MCTPLILSLTVQDGISPLYAASQEGHTEIVDLLVRAGANIHQATTKVHNICDITLDTNNCMQYWHVIIASLNEVYMPVMSVITSYTGSGLVYLVVLLHQPCPFEFGVGVFEMQSGWFCSNTTTAQVHLILVVQRLLYTTY